MKIIISVAVFLLLTCAVSYADWFHVMVEYACDSDNDYVSVKYKGAYNEAGEEMLANKPANAWDPWNLIKTDGDSHIVSTVTVEKKCKLSDGEYVVQIKPDPGNYNLQGQCGAHMSAKASILKDGDLLRTVFFDSNCSDWEGTVITEIKAEAGRGELKIDKIQKDDFYK